MASTMHYIDHVQNWRNNGSSTTKLPTNTTSTTIKVETTTLSPIEEDQTMSWLPYAIAGTAVTAIIILTLFCCCRVLRDLFICCCFVKRGNKLMTPSEAVFDSRFNSNINPGNTSGIVTTHSFTGVKHLRRPKSSVRPTARSSVIRSSATGSPQNSSSVISRSKISSKSPQSRSASRSRVPSASGINSQNLTESMIKSGRKSRPPMQGSVRPVPSMAPSAAVQVARTQKIIGNILTKENSKKRTG